MEKQAELFTSEWGVRNDVKHLVDALQDKLPAMGMVKNAPEVYCQAKTEATPGNYWGLPIKGPGFLLQIITAAFFTAPT